MARYRGSGSSSSSTSSMGSDPIEDRASSEEGRRGGLSRAQRRRPAGHPPDERRGSSPPRCLSPDDSLQPISGSRQSGPIRNIRASSGRSPERESMVGSPGRVRGARPGPSQPPCVPRGDCFGAARLAMTDPSPPEPRAHAWVQGKQTLSPGRGKCGLDALRPSTSLRPSQ